MRFSRSLPDSPRTIRRLGPIRQKHEDVRSIRSKIDYPAVAIVSNSYLFRASDITKPWTSANLTVTDAHQNETMKRLAIPRQQAYGINRRKIGDVVVTLINDSSEEFSFDILSDNITADEAKGLLTAANLPPIPRMAVNVYVVQDEHRTNLNDGRETNCLGTGGRLHYALSAANIGASQIDTILLTHAHPDHVGGLAAHNATPLFPNAELVLNAEHLRFWRDDENFRNTPNLHGTRSLALRPIDRPLAPPRAEKSSRHNHSAGSRSYSGTSSYLITFGNGQCPDLGRCSALAGYSDPPGLRSCLHSISIGGRLPRHGSDFSIWQQPTMS
jgi:Metallo-beta-lactamase superfamily